ncbi:MULTISPECIES: helix-turn-helix transcriptional regulator [unclassified Crossiella]|uniref:helix-turn-helix domain-containing protein n=1 Tax=unclassified Crossiella TaxID=2620835 RepID=UPI001FFFD7F6|nr:MULTISPECIES: helix-turn-helix transcriptional regulator [unclassified Crossiella]MCK2238214.1 helix-turn-helix transcriptional regulator [Crossiella sp. S99.2]MCK2256254.1 helix-turn-helix transcriptional regulator [Crossiella sp. S99.1]
MAIQPSSPLADCRHAAGYTQETFADKLGVDRTTVGRWERGVQSPQPWQRPDLATALDVSLDHLDDLLRRTKRHTNPSAVLEPFLTPGPSFFVPLADHQPGPVNVFSGDDAVHAAIPRLRRALDSIDLPDDGPTRSFAELAAEVAGMIEHRLQARYVEMAWRLPGLISELARAHADARHGVRDTAMLLTLAFRAADGVAYKFGYLDLSARIIDLMRVSALAAEDPLLVAAVAYVRTETFFATGDLASASRLLMAAADDLSADLGASASSAAAFGALHMRAAVVAGRAGKPDAAWDHLGEAHRATRQVPEGVYFGTAFGPASVRIHELAVAVELGDSPAAVERAASWHPPGHLPAERRSHYYIDLARAQLRLGHHHDAYLGLEAARQVAPQHVREHPQVRQTLSALLRTHGSPDDRLLELAAWARAR